MTVGRRAARTAALVLVGSALVTTAAPAQAATLATGALSLESVNYPGRYLRHADALGRLDAVTSASPAQTRLDATFTVVNGLATPSCHSFQTKDGLFLRHRDWRLRVDANTGDATFRADATFCAVDGSVPGSISLTSYNNPNRRIRHRDFALWLDPYQDTAAFRADSSFTTTAPWAPKTNRNPVIPGLFADPHVIVAGGRYHLYATTDGYAGWGGTYYKAFSSADRVNWTDHGVVLDHGPDVSWADDSAWAPAVATAHGRYYLYFSGGAASGNTAKHLGVAVSDSPTGPFRDALGRPLVTAGQFSGQAIDPMVFTDDDGRSYLYWGQGAARVVPLNDDMTSFDPARVRVITPSGYNEAPFVFKRNGIYYLMWSENDTRSEDYRVAYATGTSPTGPWTRRGVVLQKRLEAGIKGTGHHSVVQAPGTDTWYIAYHRFAVPAGNGTNREVALDRLEFDAGGAIRPVVPTL
ncbi:family 43 glycosylhydrolase [Sphaerisporangium sp. TRM90804]|uniref:family 43 glycosylhydrolase n=1 Tax=Sphaerisporangium sp. TRM90804 TaxID=3031113 RepID=UPI0024480A04|nr:family 43 glycosylhydrolase [Sphaerisporangium sp. TRM90804]MDH2430600.1 family 43 glycosylhydrolase [Sphaerisporangium sp. TRM90804]